MCSCLKQLPCEFADRAGAVCKMGGGGGREGRVALGPIRAFPSRRWEFSSKAAGARAGLRAPAEPAGRARRVPCPAGWERPAPQSHEPAATAAAVGHRCGWATSSLSSPDFPKSGFYPEADTCFIAPSLLALKPEKHYFQNSRGEERGVGSVLGIESSGMKYAKWVTCGKISLDWK